MHMAITGRMNNFELRWQVIQSNNFPGDIDFLTLFRSNLV